MSVAAFGNSMRAPSFLVMMSACRGFEANVENVGAAASWPMWCFESSGEGEDVVSSCTIKGLALGVTEQGGQGKKQEEGTPPHGRSGARGWVWERSGTVKGRTSGHAWDVVRRGLGTATAAASVGIQQCPLHRWTVQKWWWNV